MIDALPSRYRAIAVVAAGCGLRQGEVRAPRRRRRVPAPPPARGAADQDRPQQADHRSEAVAVELAEHLRRHGPLADQLVFTTREHKPLNRNYFNSHLWRPALLAAGVEPCRANGKHALRHFHASVLIDAGESVKAVAEYLGHADPGFTLRVYAHLFPSSEDRARSAVDRVLREGGLAAVTGPAYDDEAARRPQ